jgi:RNA polymerase sigma-70 factor (ECF subfamily)
MSVDVESLYVRYGPMVHRRCRALLKNEDWAADAVQEVFVALLRSQGRLQDKGLSSLLYTMATNQCLNQIRAEKSRPHLGGELLDEIATLDDSGDRSTAQDTLEHFFRPHPVSSRAMAVLYWVDGLTLEETARTVGLSVSGVRKRLTRLKEQGRLLKEAFL